MTPAPTLVAPAPTWPAPEPDEHEMGIVGASAPVRALRARLTRLGPSDAPVLIQGESGSGKELVARALHALSPRRARPFVALNCAGEVPEGLLESELFGHRRGAFTGAVDDRPGLLAAADGGTLFLDEAGDMSLAMQARLLRALEAGEARPVGGERPRRVDVRVLAATHRDVRAEVRAGRFRADLFYRLAVLEVRVPPLRERAGDVPRLVRRWLEQHAPARGVEAGALARLEAHPWPGNVRELHNALRRALVLARGPALEADDLELAPPGRAAPSPDGPAPRPLDEVARREALRALEREGGHVGRAARLLGIDRATLYRKLKRWGAR